MNIDIRKNIIQNFIDADESEIRASIVSSIQDGEEVTLPGLGVFFELLWNCSDVDFQNVIVHHIQDGIRGKNK